VNVFAAALGIRKRMELSMNQKRRRKKRPQKTKKGLKQRPS
jgi:hypothetical protein